MFNFTTTTVINNNVDFTTGDELISAASGNLNIRRHLNFKKENVVGLFKTPYKAPEVDKAEIDFDQGFTEGDTLRIALYIRLTMNSQNSYYSNDLVFKGKPLYCEVLAKDTAAATATAAKEAFDKYQLAVYEKNLIKLSVDGNKLVIEGIDEYQRFTKVDLEKYEENEEHPYRSEYKVVASGTVTPGTEGFGSYRWLLQNFRLPTGMNRAYGAINRDEAPVPGGQYTEYVIRYCVNRGVMGGDAVGEVTKSVTTHVFYVESNVVNDFEDAIKTAFGVTDLDVADEAPYLEVTL